MRFISKHLGIATIIMALSVITLGGVTKAAYDSSLTGATCALSIHPFKVGGISVSDTGSQWFNIFTGNGTCTQHLTYPNQYSPQPPTANDNPFKNVAGVENRFAPTTRHNHIYKNASKEDTFWYKSYMAKFQVTLENDSLGKTDKAQIVCGTATGPSSYVETPGCNGTVSNWGTTKISFNQNTGVITWDFAENADKTGRPMLWGNNPSLNKPYGYFGVYVKLVSKENPEEVWSATTTSRALIRDLALLKNSEDDDANDGDTVNDGDAPSCANDGVPGAQKDFDGNWCTTDAPSLSGVEGTETNDGKQYYWFRIGSVGTVWKKPAATPPPGTCTSLNLSPSGSVSVGTLPRDFTVSSTADTGVNLKYEWSSNNLNGNLSFDSNAYTGTAYTDTNSTTRIAYTGPAPVGSLTATVIALNRDTNERYSQCQKTVTFTATTTPPPGTCRSLTVSPSGSVSVGTLPRNFTVNSTADTGVNLKYRWTASNSNGLVSFDNTPYRGTAYDDTNSTTNIAYTGSNAFNTITLTVTAVNSSTNEVYANECQQQITLVPETTSTPSACESLALSIVQEGRTYASTNVTGLKANVPMEFTVAPTFSNGTARQPDLDYKWTATNLRSAANAGTFRIGPNTATNTYPGLNPLVDDDLRTLYSGGDGGTTVKVVAQTANGTAVNQCTKQFVIPTQSRTCLDLQISPTGPLSIDRNGYFQENIEVTSQVEGDLDLAYRFEANQNGIISFNGQAFNGTPYFSRTGTVTLHRVGTAFPPYNLVVTITAVNDADRSQVFAQQCRKQITIVPETTTPPPGTCNSLTVTPSGTMSVGTLPRNFTVSSNADPGVSLRYRWTSNNSNGIFSFDGSAYTGTPYVDTNNITNVTYNGGSNFIPRTITVTAINATTGQEFGSHCQQTINIIPNDTPPPPPETGTCNSITLSPTGPLTAEPLVYTSKTQDFTVTPSVGSGITLKYRWTASNINGIFSFDGTPYRGTAYDDTNTQMRLDYSNRGTVTVTAINAVTGEEYGGQCKKIVTINLPTPPSSTSCEAVTVSSSGGNPLDENEGSILSAVGRNTDGSIVPYYNWQTTGGNFQHYIQNPSMAFCSAYPFSAYPAPCTPLFTGGPEGTNISVTALDSNLSPSNNAQCRGNITVTDTPPPPEAVCTGLTVTPGVLDADGNTTLRARVSFSRAGTYTATVGWSGRGDFDNNNQTGSTSSSSISYPSNNFEADDAQNSFVNVRVTSITGAANSAACLRGIRIEPPEYECEDITAVQNGDQICLDVDGDYTGDFTWEFGGRSTTTDSPNCITLPAGTSYEVFATDEPNNEQCQLRDTTNEVPPQIRKEFSLNGTQWSDTRLATIQANQDRVFYRIVFEPGSPRTSAIMKDTISDRGGFLEAELLPTSGGRTPGRITLEGMQISEQGFGQLNSCETQNFGPNGPAHCYVGDLHQAQGIQLVRVDNPVTIEYTGRLNSILENQEVCNEGVICQEKYRNQARAEFIRIYPEQDSPEFTRYDDIFSNDITLQIFCQYILTRAAGDIFLENDLTSGIDIRQCSNFRSTTGVIITPGTPDTFELGKTGAGEAQMFTINHEICTQGQAGTLNEKLGELYGEDVSKLSSQICEVKLRTGSPWRQETITNSIDENKTRVSRFEADAIGNTEIFSLTRTDEDKQVYHVKDGNLTIDEYTLYDGQGAKTFIVENGNLIIKGDIKYGPCTKDDRTPCNVREIASLAFIVLNGNISIEPDVTEISGVFYVQEGDRNPSGRLFSTGGLDSANPLTVYGSIYGDIDPLFKNRPFAGDPSKDEGGIVIRFDERVILNTPQGLRDILSLSQIEVAR